jgi:hypothetical protein
LKIHELFGRGKEGGNPGKAARRGDGLQFRGLGRYHFCFVTVTGRMVSIKYEVRECLRLRQSQHLKHFLVCSGHALELGFGGRQFPGSDRIGESAGLVRPVAKGLVRGVPAAAETDDRPTGQAEGLALRIYDFEVAFYADGSVVIDSDFRSRHFFSLTTEYVHNSSQRQAQMHPPPSPTILYEYQNKGLTEFAIRK